ncbi:flavin reductase (plasmid) [Paraburkholderia sp. D15]|uniref:flavin reductase n=1 Tax=Paraburkholderia sp. D15 TaxID=2880218 RepID=UPI00247ABBEB|nr:flavin reductase [Paraburkholderia sp. D15]WGS55270.1 flavin reductase [Paraburkholderia sp. D15]
MTTSTSTFEQRQLRDVLGTFVTGVTVVTTLDEHGVAHGVTANSFSSVSLDPPLVLWSQALTSKSYPAFRDSNHFAVNILAHDQIAISNHFARSSEDKFNGIVHDSGIGGVPVLDGAAGHLECVKVAAYPSGDHVVYIGRVERIGHSGRRGLAFGSGKYMLAYSHDLEASSFQRGGARPVPLDSLGAVRELMPAIAARLGDHTLCLAVWGNHGPTAIHWEPSRHPVSDQLLTGLVMPVTQSASGKAFAAFLSADITGPFIDEDLRLFPVSGESLAARRVQFDEELAGIRQKGVASTIGTDPSPLHGVPVNSFSVPVRDTDSEMVMALTLTSVAERLRADPDGEVPQGLISAAKEISERLKAHSISEQSC